MSEHEQPCRLCGTAPALGQQRLCAACARNRDLHRATVAADPDRPMSDETALARLIVQRERSWAGANPYPSSYSIDLAVVVIELESSSASTFILWPSSGFRRWGQQLIDLAENSDDFDGIDFHIHDGLNLFINRRGPVSRHLYRGLVQSPSAVATWVGDAGRAACAVRVERVPGAHLVDALGEAAWQRLHHAIGACGVDLDPADRTVRFEHGPAPDFTGEGAHTHPADLAVAVALLIDAGEVDPAICEDAAMCAQIGLDGALICHPIGITGLAVWAVEGGWTRLLLADLDAEQLTETGLSLAGWEHLGDLIDTWRPGRGVTLTSGPHDRAAEE